MKPIKERLEEKWGYHKGDIIVVVKAEPQPENAGKKEKGK